MKDKLEIFLKEIKKKTGKLPEDLHITRKAGALVAISRGKVIHTGKPMVKYCPLFKALFGKTGIDKDSIREKFDIQFDRWGMFTCDRVIVEDKIIVPFGASEMMMYALKRKIADSAVLVCEGAGTVITSNPGLVQGIGAYMNGVFYTTPVEEIIKKIQENKGKVYDAAGAGINQPEGVKASISMGYRDIVVTVRGDQEEAVEEIRGLEKEKNVNITILSVCNTGINKEQARIIKECSDIAWACASKNVWDIVGPASILQLGMKIPVFILTEKGIGFISGYSKKENLDNIDFGKKHYITMNRQRSGGIKMNLGRFSVHLFEAKMLPLHTSDEPRPLY